MTDCAWIGSSVEYPDVPEWMRVSEYYGRGYREIEKMESEARCIRDSAVFARDNPDEVFQNRRWTEAEYQYVIDNYCVLPIGEMMEYLDRSEDSIRTKAALRGIRAPAGGRGWTRAETQYVLDHYEGRLSVRKIAETLDRTRRSVMGRVYRMGLAVRKVA